MRFQSFRVVVLSALFLLCAWPASADTVDQSSPPVNMSAALNSCCSMLAQIYTAGLTGTLTGINLALFSNQSTYGLQVSIYSVVNGLPGALLTSATFAPGFSPGTNYPGFLVTFPQAIAQLAGTQYAIVASVPGAPAQGGGGYWWGSCCDQDYYTGGQALMFFGGNWVEIIQNGDLTFQTHVNVVPEPGTLVLLGTGILAAWTRKRRLR